jgi:hypothetical protein
MSPTAQKIMAFLLLAFLAAPTGLCSLSFTPMGIGSFWEKEPARSYGMLVLICAIIGRALCGSSMWGAIRLARAAQQAPPNPTPPP